MSYKRTKYPYHKILTGATILIIVLLQVMEFDPIGFVFLIAFSFIFFIESKWLSKERKGALQNRPKWVKNGLITAVYVGVILSMAISLVVVMFKGSPFDMWALTHLSLSLLVLVYVLERVMCVSLLPLRLAMLLVLILFTYDFLGTTKALWPNRNEAIFGLSERPYSFIQAGGWDWSEEWYRIPATPEEFVQMMQFFNRYEGIKGAPKLVRDSLDQVPRNSAIGIRPIKPFRNITEPCEYWHSETTGMYGISSDYEVYYHRQSNTAIVTLVTEMY